MDIFGYISTFPGIASVITSPILVKVLLIPLSIALEILSSAKAKELNNKIIRVVFKNFDIFKNNTFILSQEV